MHRAGVGFNRVQEEVGVTIFEILKKKGRQIIKVRLNDTVLSVVGKLSEHRIGAVVVEDDWMRPVGIWSRGAHETGKEPHECADHQLPSDR